MNKPALFLLFTTLVYAIALTNARSAKLKLVPTLTVDVSPSTALLPTPFETGKLKEYHFPVGERFNISCVIKNPSIRHFLSISRRTVMNNGTKDASFSLIGDRGYYANPDFPNQEDRLQVQTEEFFMDYDQSQLNLRVSVIMRNLKISDSGFYKCAYHDIVKEIKVNVFKQAHSQDIVFPITAVKTVNLKQPSKIACRVNEIYPKPTVSFVLPGGEKAKSKDIRSTDLSPSNNSYYFYSERAELNYTPVYSDHNKNLTCSVFSIGSTNLTVEKKLLMNVEGFQIVNDKCLSYFTADLNDQDVEYSCIFFANPPLKPIWTTKKNIPEGVKDEIKSDAEKIVNELNTEKPDIEKTVSNFATVSSVVSKAINSVSDLVEISEQEDASSNYVSSIEELENGLYKAVFKVKKASVDDFKEYTVKFTSTDSKITEHVVSLKKPGFDKRIKALGGSASFLSNNIVHSTLIIAVTSLFIHLNR